MVHYSYLRWKAGREEKFSYRERRGEMRLYIEELERYLGNNFRLLFVIRQINSFSE